MSLLLWDAPLTKYLELPVNTTTNTRAQITAVKFLIQTLHTPLLLSVVLFDIFGLYDIFLKSSIPLLC